MKIQRRYFLSLLLSLPLLKYKKLDRVKVKHGRSSTSIKEAKWYKILPLLFLVALFSSSCHKKNASTPKTEQNFYSVVSGSFYPKNSDTLRTMLQNYSANVSGLEKVKGKILGLISPHAGYIYAAPVGVYGYTLLAINKDKIPHLIVIVGISHYFMRPYVAVIDKDYYVTPLGKVKIATNWIKKLIKEGNGLIVKDELLFSREHSVETQIPYLQFALGNNIKIVPLVMGTQDLETSVKLGKLLRNVFGDKAFYIASTDLSHYHPYDVAKKLDEKTIKYIQRGEPEILYAAIKNHEAEMCSWGPVIAVLTALQGKFDKIKLLKYLNSGDTAGPFNRVVGYASMVILNTGTKKEGKMELEKLTEERLTDEERVFLLKLARQTIASVLEGKDPPDWKPPTKRLLEPGAVFVTLKEHGELRGCIGTIVPYEPLVDNVKHMAIEAAFHDPRFPPLRKNELPLIEIEISRLTPIKPVKDISEIKVGRDGLIITRGPYRGLLLPQVPVEYNWDLYTFLDHTCLKAGLAPGCWKDPGTKIEKFSAEVWDEKEYRDQLQ